jgi:hypothetical protein
VESTVLVLCFACGNKSGTTYLDVWLPVANDAASQRVLYYVIRIHGLKKERQETSRPG